MSRFEERMRELQVSSESFLAVSDYYLLQLDGRAFHSFTEGMVEPFDDRFMAAMDEVLLALAADLGCVVFGFVQSDEISLLLKGSVKAEGNGLPFGGRVEKLVSTSAGLASAVMSRLYLEKECAVFDARVFGVTAEEVLEWFHWRQTDCVKNSVSAVGQSVFTVEDLFGVNTVMLRKMLEKVGVPWERFPDGCKFGRVLIREESAGVREFVHKGSGRLERVEYVSSVWTVKPASGMFYDSGFLKDLI